jgi:hypothetical protein
MIKDRGLSWTTGPEIPRIQQRFNGRTVSGATSACEFCFQRLARLKEPRAAQTSAKQLPSSFSH